MRILYIVTAYSRAPGDVITPWLTETIRRLRARDVDVEVLAPAYRGLGEQELDGVRVHRFRYAPARWEDLTHDQTAPDRVRDRPLYLGLVPGYVAGGSLAAARLARSGRFDAVHVHWPIPHGIMGLAARRASGLPLVSTFHGVELTWVQRGMPVLRPLLRHIIRVSDAVTANSTHTAGLIRALVDRPVARIPFGATVEPGGEAECREVTDSIAPPRPFRLLFVGRLVERKGVQYLLRALAMLPDDMDVRLVVVGEGPEGAALEAEAGALGVRDRVEFRGFVPDAELAAAYREAHAFVLPAVRDRKGDVEGLGVVLVEAQMHCRPVVASRSGGIPDVVLDGQTGLLVPPRDVPLLATAIERLARDERLRARLARGGLKHARREFSWDTITDRLMDLYRSILR